LLVIFFRSIETSAAPVRPIMRRTLPSNSYNWSGVSASAPRRARYATLRRMGTPTKSGSTSARRVGQDAAEGIRIHAGQAFRGAGQRGIRIDLHVHRGLMRSITQRSRTGGWPDLDQLRRVLDALRQSSRLALISSASSRL
jgi:hypothetical protein